MVRRSLEGWNRGDFEAWVDGIHPEIEWFSEVAMSMEGAETVFRGTDGMRKYWDEWHSIWDVRICVSDLHDYGETVLVVAQVRTHGGASGIDTDVPVAYVFEFDGSLVRRARSYLDPQRAFDAVTPSE